MTTVFVEVWVDSWENEEAVKDWIEDTLDVSRDRIVEIECEETRIDSDGEGNVLASYSVTLKGERE